jgi:hypothetical protein
MAKSTFLPRYRFPNAAIGFAVLFGLWVCLWSGLLKEDEPMPYAILEPIRSVGLAIFRSADNILMIFGVAMVVHLAEAIYAYTLVAADRDAAFKAFWVIQTLIFGFPSLSLLTKGKISINGKRK